jgi:hypothetical protein
MWGWFVHLHDTVHSEGGSTTTGAAVSSALAVALLELETGRAHYGQLKLPYFVILVSLFCLAFVTLRD